MKVKMRMGEQMIGYNIVNVADTSGIGNMRSALKLLNALEKGVPKNGESVPSEEQLNKEVSIELDLDGIVALKKFVEEAKGLRGVNSKMVVGLYDALDNAGKEENKTN